MLSSDDSVSKVEKILPLTSIRFFAALYVLGFHLALAGGSSWMPLLQTTLVQILRLGYTGVSFFFCLSGFVLALTYCHARPGFTNRNFYVARFARIYPALVAYLLLDLPRFLHNQIHFEHQSLHNIGWALSVSFGALEAWFPNLPALDNPSWSISVEIFFYLLFPVLGSWLWRLSGMWMLLSSLTLYFCSILPILYLLMHHVIAHTLDNNPISHLPEFILGMAIARLYVEITLRPQWTAAASRYSPAALVGSAVTFLVIPVFQIAVPSSLLQHALLVPLYGLVILALAAGRSQLTSIFSHRWLVTLGEASYGLYLLHIPLLAFFRRLIDSNYVIGVPLYIVSALGLSVIGYLWIEIPARQFILRRAHIRSVESAAVASIAQ